MIDRDMFTGAFSTYPLSRIANAAAHMEGHATRLLRAFERWASNRGAVEVNSDINSGIHAERLARYARRMEYVFEREAFVRGPR